MGQRVSNGYLAGKGPAVVVIQEWWGLVPHIVEIVERFAAEGFLAIAPDLYHGKTTDAPDEAGRLLMELDVQRATAEIQAAGQYALQHPDCTSQKYGVVGFCMGGALAQYTATHDPNVGAAVSFYGGFKKVETPWENLNAPILLIYGENDQGVPAEQGRELGAKLQKLGKNAEVVIYPNAGHGFFNDARPQQYSAEASPDAWRRTLELFRRSL